MRVPSIPRAALWTCGLLLACGPEGEQILSSSQDAACAASDAALVDGISTGDELIAVFECANAAGQLDPLAPTLYAMQASADPAGATISTTDFALPSNFDTSIARARTPEGSISDAIAGGVPPLATRRTAVPFLGAEIFAKEMVGRTVMEILRFLAPGHGHSRMADAPAAASQLDFGASAGDSKGTPLRQ